MARRICYVHTGPHKTGTSSIQSFLKQNRAALLRHGYFVPESGNAHGGHHPLARKLCGQTLPDHRETAALNFARQLANNPCEAVIISSEALDGLLRHPDYASTFFKRIAEFDLKAKLVCFPRHQPQWANSRYAEAVRSFCLWEPFETFARSASERPSLRYSPFVQIADTYKAELIARPFTAETIAAGVVPEFLKTIGLDAAEFSDTNVRRNETVGPFTIAVARGVLRAIDETGRQLKWRQATRCKAELAAYLQKKARADSGYCGLRTELARQIETSCRPDNDAFAQRVWRRSWNEVFAGDVGLNFSPNDFELSEPDAATQKLLAETIHELTPIVEEILRDPILAVEAPWNDLRQRGGWNLEPIQHRAEPAGAA